MNYDELVALLRGPNPGYAEASAAAQAIESLQARVAELESPVILSEWQKLERRCERAEAELAAARALLRDCLPELDGEGVTIHRVWAALAKDAK